MKARYRATLLASTLVFLIPLPASAEIRAKSFEVTPFVGYNFFETTQNLKDRPVFGGRLGYNFTKHFGIEGAVEFISTRVDDKTTTDGMEGRYLSPTDRVNLTFYHLNAVYHFMPDSRFTPFVLAGFGGSHSSPEISTRDMAAFNVGVGAKYAMTDNIALRMDIRDYMVTEILQETYHNVAATVGITFSFGGERKPAQAKAPQQVAAKPEPVAEKPVVVVLASEPKVEEKIVVLADEPKIEEKIIVLALEDIHFDFDKSTLTREAQTILKRNIEILKKNPKAIVRVAGYTSASGTEEYNQRLSERRANAVKDYLVKEGVISADRLSTIGYGQTRPAMHESAPKDLYSKAAQANMRVLFEISIKQEVR